MMSSPNLNFTTTLRRPKAFPSRPSPNRIHKGLESQPVIPELILRLIAAKHPNPHAILDCVLELERVTVTFGRQLVLLHRTYHTEFLSPFDAVLLLSWFVKVIFVNSTTRYCPAITFSILPNYNVLDTSTRFIFIHVPLGWGRQHWLITIYG